MITVGVIKGDGRSLGYGSRSEWEKQVNKQSEDE